MCEKVSKDYVSTNQSLFLSDNLNQIFRYSLKEVNDFSCSSLCVFFFTYLCKNMKLSMCHDHNFTLLNTETSFVHKLKPGNVQKAWLL